MIYEFMEKGTKVCPLRDPENMPYKREVPRSSSTDYRTVLTVKNIYIILRSN